MLTLYDGTTVSEYTAATALTLEARRQGKSYGQLVADTDRWKQQEIILNYCDQKRGVSRRERPEGMTCGDCALWRWDVNSKRGAGGWCPIPKHGAAGQKYANRKKRACMQFRERTSL